MQYALRKAVVTYINAQKNHKKMLLEVQGVQLKNKELAIPQVCYRDHTTHSNNSHSIVYTVYSMPTGSDQILNITGASWHMATVCTDASCCDRSNIEEG